MSPGDYVVVFGVSSWLHQRNLIWFGRNPHVTVHDLLDLAAVLISCSVRGDDLDEYDLKEREAVGGLGERIIISNDEK